MPFEYLTIAFRTRKYKEAEAAIAGSEPLREELRASDPRHIQALDRFVCLLLGANRRGSFRGAEAPTGLRTESIRFIGDR